MNYRHLFAGIMAVVLCLCCIGLSSAYRTENQRPFIDLIDLLLMYISPTEWSTGAEPDSPIYWHTRGIKWLEKTAIREGEVVITIDGKPFSVGTNEKMPVLWSIRLNGSRTGIGTVEITSPHGVSIDLEQEMGKRGIDYELVRASPSSEATRAKRLYKMKPAPASWLYCESGCSEDTCGVKLKLFPGSHRVPAEVFEFELVPERCENVQH